MMKRLTKTYSDGSFGVSDDLPCGENSYDFKNLLIKTLGEYEDAEENGLLVRLPCKVEDTVYVIIESIEIEESKVRDVSWRGIKFAEGQRFWLTIGAFIYFEQDIGNNVFLTLEEAEEALKKKMENKR